MRSTHTASSSMLRPCRPHPSLLSPVIASRGVFKWAIAKQRRHAVAVVIGADRVLRPISGSAPIVLTRMRILRDESGDNLVCADHVAKRRIGLNTRDRMPDKAHQPPLSDPRAWGPSSVGNCGPFEICVRSWTMSAVGGVAHALVGQVLPQTIIPFVRYSALSLAFVRQRNSEYMTCCLRAG